LLPDLSNFLGAELPLGAFFALRSKLGGSRKTLSATAAYLVKVAPMMLPRAFS